MNKKEYKNDLPQISAGKIFWMYKRLFDIIISLVLLPVLLILFLVISILNFFLNPGSTFYYQKRMGLDCKDFTAIKFRSMTNIDRIERKYDDPVEVNRITRFGNVLRKSRIDELPQIVNVLKGEMSLIGPRPDYFEHALIFLETIEEYRWRHIIRPGISGLAQIRLGYAQGLDATRKKVQVDLYYIKNVSFSLDIKILINTIIIVFRRLGI